MSEPRRARLPLGCLVGLKENQRINPLQSKFAPAEGVTPVHSAPCTIHYRCLPTGVTGSRSRPTPPGFGQIVLCRPDAWVRVSFAHTRVSIVGWIYDPDHSFVVSVYGFLIERNRAFACAATPRSRLRRSRVDLASRSRRVRISTSTGSSRLGSSTRSGWATPRRLAWVTLYDAVRKKMISVAARAA
jgi:hypothetical protein